MLLIAGKVMRVCVGHVDSVESVALSAGGDLAASGSADSTVCLWNTETGKLGLLITSIMDT